jgi:hypothetical protein
MKKTWFAEYLSGLDESNVTYLRKRLLDSQKREEEFLALNDEEYAKNRASRARSGLIDSMAE